MPPYAGNFETHSEHDWSLVDVPLDFKSNQVEGVESSALESIEEKKKSLLAKMLCPCTVKIANPSSALFKIRTCAECGEQVHKYSGGGYEKEEYNEIVRNESGEESLVETKIYFHKCCLQAREDRINHKNSGFATVLGDLLGYFQDKAEKKRTEEESAARKLEQEAAEARALAQAYLEEQQTNKGLARRLKRSLKVFSKKSKNSKVSDASKPMFEPVEIWKTAIDPKSGKTYYYHATTRETTWHKPDLRRQYEVEYKKWSKSVSMI
eukprot:CAMPEP_0116133032 /NCGR_PEP_ID=MMETSP0329-20121206/9883_1 /TAXON_ID=697910 /ORGANISM="Pseudo-nitzschia arenysensis, Strain B593" /LENGTH=265 /DNA_ID=CAMNT_0003627623 /DNA_START=48 /DNA_END=845 /DNA_ORIENTATION=-